MTTLSVNVNAVAQLRNRRNLPWPSVVGISRIALQAGASGITVHPRPDERHIRRTDVHELAEFLAREFPDAEFNIEGYPSADFLALCAEIRPDQVTLVPDDPAQSTSDHGWDIAGHADQLREVIAGIHAYGARVSLFIDAEPGRAAEARSVGADRVELFTGPYGGAFEPAEQQRQLGLLKATAEAALAAGLGINAGHDLTLENIPPLQKAVPGVLEASIGHAITADALIMGFGEAVRRYRSALGAE